MSFLSRHKFMSKITIYEKSTCTKCRQTLKILQDAGVKYKEVHYYDTPLSPKTIKDLLKKLGMTARELMRTGEKTYRELNLKDENLSEKDLIKAMAANPDLIERPIVVRGNRAVLGRPPENVKELI